MTVEQMDIRDYFAAQAMPLALEEYKLQVEAVGEPLGDGNWRAATGLSFVAELAYELAEAMMEARK